MCVISWTVSSPPVMKPASRSNVYCESDQSELWNLSHDQLTKKWSLSLLPPPTFRRICYDLTFDPWIVRLIIIMIVLTPDCQF